MRPQETVVLRKVVCDKPTLERGDISHLLRDCADHNTRDGWIELAQAYFDKKEYLGAYWAAEQAFKIVERKPDDDPKYWGPWPHDLAGSSAFYVGLKNQSFKYMINAWSLSKFDQRLAMNVKFIRRHLDCCRIILLWPTVRPRMMQETYEQWISKAERVDRISVKVAVNTEEQLEELNTHSNFEDVIVVGSKRPGVVSATYQLTKSLIGLPGDIVILASDDFYPPEDWDNWIYSKMDFGGGIIVNDGTNRAGTITLPIMDYYALVRMNMAIYHPSYHHFYSDNELYSNLKDLNLLKNFQQADQPVYEHKHWFDGQRLKSGMDEHNFSMMEVDKANFIKRSSLPLNERLKV